MFRVTKVIDGQKGFTGRQDGRTCRRGGPQQTFYGLVRVASTYSRIVRPDRQGRVQGWRQIHSLRVESSCARVHRLDGLALATPAVGQPRKQCPWAAVFLPVRT